MQKLKFFLVLTGYQITWLACIFGETKIFYPFLGLIIGIIFLLLYYYFSKNKQKFIKTAVLISLPGYLFDTFMVYFKIYEFNSISIFGTLPLWMIVLWLSFSTLFDEVLVFFKNYRVLGITLSGILGPLTYYLGVPIGVLNIYDYQIFIITMIIFWIMLMIYYLNYVIKIN